MLGTNQTLLLLLLLVCLPITGCIVATGCTRAAPDPTIVQTGTGTVSASVRTVSVSITGSGSPPRRSGTCDGSHRRRCSRGKA